jgi:hypothetical protein
VLSNCFPFLQAASNFTSVSCFVNSRSLSFAFFRSSYNFALSSSIFKYDIRSVRLADAIWAGVAVVFVMPKLLFLTKKACHPAQLCGAKGRKKAQL